jgi:uncharacterized membrane protein
MSTKDNDKHSLATQGKHIRFLSVDTLRGFAMVLVLLQHAYLSADYARIPHFLDMFIWDITYAAAVFFVSISGMMYSYFLSVKPDWKVTYNHYARRAFFLLLVVHPTINLISAYFRLVDHFGTLTTGELITRIFLDFPITDTIGLCILLAPVFIVHLRPLFRLFLVVAMLVGTELVRAFVIPPDANWHLLQEAIFGGVDLPRLFWFPLIPWLAIFLSGSFIGEGMARVKRGALDVAIFSKHLYRVGIALAVLCLILNLDYELLKLTYGKIWNKQVFLAIYPGQTTTLLPGYLAVIMLYLFFFLNRIDIAGRYDRFSWCLSIAGRTSLFTYVVQFAVVESIPALLGFKGKLGFIGFVTLFVTGMIVMGFISYAYGSYRGWILKNDYAETVNNLHQI